MFVEVEIGWLTDRRSNVKGGFVFSVVLVTVCSIGKLFICHLFLTLCDRQKWENEHRDNLMSLLLSRVFVCYIATDFESLPRREFER